MDQTATGALVEAGEAGSSSSWVDHVARLTNACFLLWLALSLTTPSVRNGPFSWWPLFTLEEFGGGRIAVGLLTLLPILAATGWALLRLAGRPRRPWRWGRPEVVIPLLGLTLLGLVTLDPTLTRRTILHGDSFVIAWFVLLFLVNRRPSLTVILSAVILAQSGVAIGQFLLQSDLGLVAWGELPLDPTVEGVVVLQARGRPWLRAYGLTAHPNVLGAMLAALWLLVLPAYRRTRAWRRRVLALVLAAGLLGLLVSFSRAAWLAFVAALILWLALSRREGNRKGDQAMDLGRLGLRLLLLAVPGFLLLFFYRDLALSRFLSLDTAIEAQSISDRLRDSRLALHLIAEHPARGVGLGNFRSAALALDEDALIVHNVPLLVAAELGIPALLLWGWLILAPFARRAGRTAARLPPWLLLIVVGMFDVTLWWGPNWHTAILFALLVAHVCSLAGAPGADGRRIVDQAVQPAGAPKAPR